MGKLNRFKVKSYQIIIFVFIILLAFYISSFLVDLYNFHGIRDWMVDHDGFNIPFLWNYLFSEGGPVEIFQWLFIGLFMMTSSYIAGISVTNDKKSGVKFWFLFAILAVLMIMEDAGNVRHFLTVRGILLFRDEMIYRSITELTYFGLMALIPVYALIRYREVILEDKKTALIMFFGCAFYGLAVAMSGTRDIRFWYQTAGNIIYEWSLEFGGDELLALYENADHFLAEGGYISIRYRFMDFLVEESLELLGAAFLWASSISYLEFLDDNR